MLYNTPDPYALSALGMIVGAAIGFAVAGVVGLLKTLFNKQIIRDHFFIKQTC